MFEFPYFLLENKMKMGYMGMSHHAQFFCMLFGLLPQFLPLQAISGEKVIFMGSLKHFLEIYILCEQGKYS